jgi:hypothetical protein
MTEDHETLRKPLPSVSLALMAIVALSPTTMAQDKLEGTMDLAWNACYPGAPSLDVPDWVGTVDFDGDVYDIIFFNLRPGYPPGHVPNEGYNPFIEAWAVYDGLELVFDEGCALETLEGDLVMWGHDAGRADTASKDYAGTGYVIEALDGFDGFAGSGMAMSGTILFDDEGAPQTAPGVLEIG